MLWPPCLLCSRSDGTTKPLWLQLKDSMNLYIAVILTLIQKIHGTMRWWDILKHKSIQREHPSMTENSYEDLKPNSSWATEYCTSATMTLIYSDVWTRSGQRKLWKTCTMVSLELTQADIPWIRKSWELATIGQQWWQIAINIQELVTNAKSTPTKYMCLWFL